MDITTLILQIITILMSAVTLILSTIFNEKNRKKKNFINVITKERLENLGLLRKNYADLLALSFPDLLYSKIDCGDINEHNYKLALCVENIKCILCSIYNEERELTILATQLLDLSNEILRSKDVSLKSKLVELRDLFSKKTDIFDHAYWFFIIGQTNEDFNDTIKLKGGDTFAPYFERTNKQYDKNVSRGGE